MSVNFPEDTHQQANHSCQRGVATCEPASDLEKLLEVSGSLKAK